MTKEEKNKLIDYMVSGDRQKWDKVAVELGYSVRQKKNIENDGLEMMYEKLKDVL